MSEAWILSFALVLVRVATFWMTVPVWSTLKPPRMVKLGLILSLTLFWFAGLDQPLESVSSWSDDSIHWPLLMVLVVRELLIGGLLGFAFHIFFVPMQIAGSYIGQELGLSLATLTDPASGAANNIVATLMQAIAVAMFFVLDLHHFIILCLDASFELVPAGQPWRIESIAIAGSSFSDLMLQGLMTGMPVAIFSFVTLVALLILTRAVPALNLFSVGTSIRLLLGLIALLVFLPSILVKFNLQFETGRQILESILGSL